MSAETARTQPEAQKAEIDTSDGPLSMLCARLGEPVMKT